MYVLPSCPLSAKSAAGQADEHLADPLPSCSKAADLEDNLKVNLFGSMYSVQAFLPLVRAGRSKRINYVSSVAGSIGSAVYAPPSPAGSLVRFN